MLASSRNVPSLTTSFSDDLGNTSDAGSALSVSSELRDPSIPTQAPKFPHTRAQLSAILREYKPLDPALSTDSDAENDYQIQANPTLVKQVVALLEEEKEDELKTLLREHFRMDDETVGPLKKFYIVYFPHCRINLDILSSLGRASCS